MRCIRYGRSGHGRLRSASSGLWFCDQAQPAVECGGGVRWCPGRRRAALVMAMVVPRTGRGGRRRCPAGCRLRPRGGAISSALHRLRACRCCHRAMSSSPAPGRAPHRATPSASCCAPASLGHDVTSWHRPASIRAGGSVDVQPLGDEVGRAAPGQDPGGGELPFRRGECHRARPAGGDLNRNGVDDAIVGEHEAAHHLHGPGRGGLPRGRRRPQAACAAGEHSTRNLAGQPPG